MPSYYVAFGSRTRGRKRTELKPTFKWGTFDQPKRCKHVIKEGTRVHVLSFALYRGKGYTRCSEPLCEINKAWDERDQS